MSDSHIIKDMLHSVGIKTSEEKRSNAKRTGDTHALVDFSRRLNQVLKKHPDVGGHLFMLNLSELKSAIKDKWESDNKKIHNRIRRIISGHLAPYDLTIRKDDITYLVLFPSLNFEEGEIKASIIAEELGSALFGKGTENHVGVRGVTSLSGGSITSREVPPVSEVLEQVTSRLSHVPKPKQRSPTFARRQPTTPLPDDTSIGAPRESLKYGEDYHFVFRPLLSVKTKVISTFLCIPVRETEAGHFRSGYDILPKDRTIEEIYDLDLTKAERIAREVKLLEQSNKRSLLALPVHFEVLADHPKRASFIEFCQNEFKGLTKRIIIEITNLPEGIPQPRLLEFVTALKPISRTVIARFSPEHRDFSACRGLGLHAVGMDVYNTPGDEAELMRQMNVFSQQAHQFQLKTYVEGVRSLSLFTAAMTSGYDYIAGYAVSGVMESADEIQAFKLDSLYMSILNEFGRTPKDE